MKSSRALSLVALCVALCALISVRTRRRARSECAFDLGKMSSSARPRVSALSDLFS